VSFADITLYAASERVFVVVVVVVVVVFYFVIDPVRKLLNTPSCTEIRTTEFPSVCQCELWTVRVFPSTKVASAVDRAGRVLLLAAST
jgi:hypothetical protein